MDGYAFAASGLMPLTIDFDMRPSYCQSGSDRLAGGPF
jgi:hypothetical protein